jgi:hypothetical protein
MKLIKIILINSAVAFFFLFFLHGFSIGNGQQGISYNVSVLCAVGVFGNVTFNLPQKPISSTNIQLTTIAPIAQNTCYGLPFQDNALGGLCKTHN